MNVEASSENTNLKKINRKPTFTHSPAIWLMNKKLLVTKNPPCLFQKNLAVEEPQPISTGEGTITKRDSYPCEEIKVLQQSEETLNVQSRPRKGRQVKVITQ